jgi:hypothetical protein
MEGKIVMVAAVMEVAVTAEEDNLTLGLGISSISYGNTTTLMSCYSFN